MPEAAGRHYYVIGHYDSRASNPLDGESDAPGADDDASGVAALMEVARVMAKRRYDATLVFMPVTGEEQGLIGARLHARAARATLPLSLFMNAYTFLGLWLLATPKGA